MRPSHFDNLKKLFKRLDTDKNGTIDYEEFKKGMLDSKDMNLNENDIKKMFQELDVAKIGEINFEALVNAAVHDYLIASDQRLYEAFRDLDDDEDGKIKTSQLKEKIKQMDVYGNSDELIKIIDSIDLDNDGTIDYEEFLRALHPDFNETPNWFWGEDVQSQRKESDSGDEHMNEDNKENVDEVDIDFVDPEIDEETKKYAQKLDAAKVQNQSAKPGKKSVNGVVKQGYMQKKGRMVKSWKKRWFVLSNDGILKYYHNENETEHISQVNVKKATKLMNKSWSKTNKKRYGIKVYTPH